MAHLLTIPKIRFFDANGVPLVAGQLFSYAAGTTTPLATYTDFSEVTPNSNPIVLDSNGECSAWIGSSAYKFVLEDSINNVIWTVDNVSTINPGYITESMLADGSVGTNKIIDSAVTTAKVQDLAIATAKIADKAVTAEKIADQTITGTQIADGAVDTAELADGAVTIPKIDNSVFYGGLQLSRNKIINGLFLVARNVTGISSISSGQYVIDRWYYEKNGTMVHNGGLVSGAAPAVSDAGRFYNSSLKMRCSTAQASIGSSDFITIGQKIEGYVFASVAQRASVLSFWVNAAKTGTYCVSLRNAGRDRSYVAEYMVNTTNTWEKKVISIPASPSVGSWAYTTSTGLDVCFTIAAGSTYQTMAGAWQSGNFLATSNQVDGCDSTSDDFSITAVQLETGIVATDFDERPLPQEVQLCARYFHAVTGQFQAYNTGVVAVGALGGTIPYRVEMRAGPSSSTISSTLVKANNLSIATPGITQVLVSADFTASAGSASLLASVALDAEL